jgi:hypothetical protein
LLVSGCGVFQGGGNCDCPRFSQTGWQEQEDAVALEFPITRNYAVRED